MGIEYTPVFNIKYLLILYLSVIIATVYLIKINKKNIKKSYIILKIILILFLSIYIFKFNLYKKQTHKLPVKAIVYVDASDSVKLSKESKKNALNKLKKLFKNIRIKYFSDKVYLKVPENKNSTLIKDVVEDIKKSGYDYNFIITDGNFFDNNILLNNADKLENEDKKTYFILLNTKEIKNDIYISSVNYEKKNINDTANIEVEISSVYLEKPYQFLLKIESGNQKKYKKVYLKKGYNSKIVNFIVDLKVNKLNIFRIYFNAEDKIKENNEVRIAIDSKKTENKILFYSSVNADAGFINRVLSNLSKNKIYFKLYPKDRITENLERYKCIIFNNIPINSSSISEYRKLIKYIEKGSSAFLKINKNFLNSDNKIIKENLGLSEKIVAETEERINNIDKGFYKGYLLDQTLEIIKSKLPPFSINDYYAYLDKADNIIAAGNYNILQIKKQGKGHLLFTSIDNLYKINALVYKFGIDKKLFMKFIEASIRKLISLKDEVNIEIENRVLGENENLNISVSNYKKNFLEIILNNKKLKKQIKDNKVILDNLKKGLNRIKIIDKSRNINIEDEFYKITENREIKNIRSNTELFNVLFSDYSIANINADEIKGLDIEKRYKEKIIKNYIIKWDNIYLFLFFILLLILQWILKLDIK